MIIDLLLWALFVFLCAGAAICMINLFRFTHGMGIITDGPFPEFEILKGEKALPQVRGAIVFLPLCAIGGTLLLQYLL